MPESKNNAHGQSGTPKTLLDDYLPDYSPQPKYVIATIYPPSCEGPEQGVINSGWKQSLLSISSGRVASSGSADTLMSSPVAIGTVGPLLKSPGRIPEPFIKERLPLMELPRGKFRSMERNISFISLLKQLHIRAFQGSCRINHDGAAILLVFDQGKIILAEYDKLAGDAALDIIRIHRFARVDAIISDLDEAQIRLSLEFNPSWKVQGNHDPSCIASQKIMQNAGRKPSVPEGEVPGQDAEQELAAAAVFPEAPAEKTPAHDVPPGITGHLDGESVPGELGGLPVSDEVVIPDWRKALEMPLVQSRDHPVAPPRHEPRISYLVEDEVTLRNAPITPLVISGSGEGIPESKLTECQEIPVSIEGWRRALYIPVVPASFDEKPSSERALTSSRRVSAVVTDFEPLTEDSGLFDDIPLGKKMPRAPAPEPAEQWRSMGTNRRENSSV